MSRISFEALEPYSWLHYLNKLAHAYASLISQAILQF